MTAKRLERHALRILGALSTASSAVVRPGGGAAMVLELDGARALRCPAELVETMVARGWVASAGDSDDERPIAITEDGRSWRRRACAGGDHAGQHRTLGRAVRPEQAKATVVNLGESPLTRLARPRRGGDPAWLDMVHVAAGERLRSDFEFGQFRQKVTACWDPARTVRDGGGTAPDLPAMALDARARFNAALKAVGPELAGPLVDICCFLKGLEHVEAERGWPRRSAKVVLRTALSALDRHYNPPPDGADWRLRHWGAAGYRPTL